MYSKNCVLFLVIAHLAYFVLPVNLPASLTKCKKGEDFNKCLQGAIESALQILSQDGIPELGIDKLEPVKVPSIIIGSSGTVNMVQNFSNCKIYGLAVTEVTKVSADLDNYRLYFETFAPATSLVADYVINGQILVIPFEGAGTCNITLFNIKETHNLIGKKVEKDGKTYLKIEKQEMGLYPESVSFYFDNLFNGNTALKDHMIAVLNENWKVVFEDVRAQYEATYGIIYRDIANEIFTKVPLDDIFDK